MYIQPTMPYYLLSVSTYWLAQIRVKEYVRAVLEKI